MIRLFALAFGALSLAACASSPTGVMVSRDAVAVGGSLYVEEYDDGDLLILDGPIDPETSYAFQSLVEQSEINGLIIAQSPGGDLASAHQIGDVIRRERINTAVLALCYSACVDVFISGRDRLIARDAELLMHAADNPQLGYKMDKPYWDRRGFGKLNDRVYQLKPNEVWIIDPERAISMRIATGYWD